MPASNFTEKGGGHTASTPNAVPGARGPVLSWLIHQVGLARKHARKPSKNFKFLPLQMASSFLILLILSNLIVTYRGTWLYYACALHTLILDTFFVRSLSKYNILVFEKDYLSNTNLEDEAKK